MSVYFHFTGAPVGHGPGLCPGERQPLDAPFSQPITPPPIERGAGLFPAFWGGRRRLAGQAALGAAWPAKQKRGARGISPRPRAFRALRALPPPPHGVLPAGTTGGQVRRRRGGGWAKPPRPLPGFARQRARSGAVAPLRRRPGVPAYRKAAKPAGLRLAPGKAGKLPALPGPPPIRMVPSGWRHMPPAGSVDPLPPRTKNLPLPDIAPTPGPLPPICGRLPHRPRPCARLPACPCA